MPWLVKIDLQMRAGALPQELAQHFSNTLQRALPRFCGGVGCGHETAERRRGNKEGGRAAGAAAELMENEGGEAERDRESAARMSEDLFLLVDWQSIFVRICSRITQPLKEKYVVNNRGIKKLTLLHL